MGCDHYREALSAQLDGEEPGVAPATVERHVEACASCRSWIGALTAVHRRIRIREAEVIPDLTPTILGPTALEEVRGGRQCRVR